MKDNDVIRVKDNDVIRMKDNDVIRMKDNGFFVCLVTMRELWYGVLTIKKCQFYKIAS